MKLKYIQSDLSYCLQAIDLMVVDALVKANDYLEISSHIDDPAQYWKVLKAVLPLFSYFNNFQNASLKVL